MVLWEQSDGTIFVEVFGEIEPIKFPNFCSFYWRIPEIELHSIASTEDASCRVQIKVEPASTPDWTEGVVPQRQSVSPPQLSPFSPAARVPEYFSTPRITHEKKRIRPKKSEVVPARIISMVNGNALPERREDHDTNLNNLQNGEVSSVECSAVIPVKKRGRPRKLNVVPKSRISSVKSANGLPGNEEQHRNSSSNLSQGEIGTIKSSSVEPQKKRGRPKKLNGTVVVMENVNAPKRKHSPSPVPPVVLKLPKKTPTIANPIPNKRKPSPPRCPPVKLKMLKKPVSRDVQPAKKREPVIPMALPAPKTRIPKRIVVPDPVLPIKAKENGNSAGLFNARRGLIAMFSEKEYMIDSKTSSEEREASPRLKRRSRRIRSSPETESEEETQSKSTSKSPLHSPNPEDSIPAHDMESKDEDCPTQQGSVSESEKDDESIAEKSVLKVIDNDAHAESDEELFQICASDEEL